MSGVRGLGVAMLCLSVVGAGVLMFRRTFAVIDVHGDSMAPTYASGDRLLVRCGRRNVRRGAVLVFRMPAGMRGNSDPEWLVKRVVAVPGDPVPPEVSDAVGGEPVVPPGSLVVRGDNPRSLDSRRFGYVPEETVLGVALRVLSS